MVSLKRGGWQGTVLQNILEGRCEQGAYNLMYNLAEKIRFQAKDPQKITI